jgi:hypothetical protein
VSVPGKYAGLRSYCINLGLQGFAAPDNIFENVKILGLKVLSSEM